MLMFNVLLQKETRSNALTVQVTKGTNNLALHGGRQTGERRRAYVRLCSAYRAYVNRNPGLLIPK